MEHSHSGIEHFSLGLWLPLLAYGVAVIGSIAGLACTRQSAFAKTTRERRRWSALAAISIGGVAIWLMHFIAMLGMSIPGSVARYDIGWTVLSAVLSMGATFGGLMFVGNEVRWGRIVPAGFVMGCAVALMHYTGMRAVRIQGNVSYDSTLVLVSVVIAVVASCVALWFALVLRATWSRVAAGFVMGVAVVGMHYTGMAAMRVSLVDSMAVPDGLEVFTFLFPVFVLGLVGLAVPIGSVLLAPPIEEGSEEDLDLDYVPAPARASAPLV